MKALSGISNIQFQYNPNGSGAGRTDFFSGSASNTFANSDSDLGGVQPNYLLPDNITDLDGLKSLQNVSSYVNPSFKKHLGAIMTPGIGAALAIVYNIPEFQKSPYSLILNGSVLGDIFSSTILWWNDTAIANLVSQI